MPRHQKSFDEQYLKENYMKETQSYTNHDNNYMMKLAEVQVQRHARPVSYAGTCGRPPQPERARDRPAHCYVNQVPDTREQAAQYASSSMLDELDTSANIDALKTRSLPAFLRPKPRPLSTEDDLQQLYAKGNYESSMSLPTVEALAAPRERTPMFS
ncbi:hypothetical protein EVAR_46274_1 [Eumeta japonica]|uniref:Uncharacterized protein n=1 Tax=Eumeta variegata TaxID=151549 RepID=A0A4C1Y5C3_EUMVA|nr:hypothetical protein EVAR_46274_1 [Eumeta japonica]